jgi:pyridoxamine 5'-phosphate oxidase
MNELLAELRTDYARSELRKAGVDPDPLRQFRHWLEEAIAAELPEPNAMTLATVDTDGRPKARVVLLKGLDETGFLFFTHYTSAKGRQLAANPHAALVFLWHELERQVRIEGRVERLPRAESEGYFRSRPRASQLGALASRQSEVVANRETLEQRFAELERQYAGGGIPMPEQWGGYRLLPTLLEFWQGRPGRLHDRLRYRRQEGGWWLERLEP